MEKKMNVDLSVKVKNIKLLEENLDDLGMAVTF